MIRKLVSSGSAVAFALLIIVFFTCFSFMLYMMLHALGTVERLKTICTRVSPHTRICEAYDYIWRIFLLLAIAFIIAFTVSLLTLCLEHGAWSLGQYSANAHQRW